MNAEIISVGTELLLGNIVDTNSAELSVALAELGINVYFHTAVGDNALRLAAVLGQALLRSDVIVVTGGLGPTQDDMTKEALAAVAGLPLELHPEARSHVEGFFKATGRPMTENNLRQALLPKGAEMLPNPRGTAPGVYLKAGKCHVFCLPGVPTEMRTMWQESVMPRLRQVAAEEAVIHSRTLHFYGIGESLLESKVEALLKGSNPTVAPYAGLGEARLRITAKAKSKEEAEALIAPVVAEIEARVGEYLYGYDGENLESVVGRLLTEASMGLAAAESCTGGLVAHRITNVPGSSAYFRQGWIAYSNDAKVKQLGVDPDLLRKYGAVSEPVARAMAEGAKERSGADYAVATTGIAGPGGGSAAKPVGLVCFGVAHPGGLTSFTRQFRGNREDIKWRSASEALNALRLALLG